MGALKALKRVLTKHGLLPKENVHYIEDDALMQAVLHPDAHEEGGLACNNAALLAEMRVCILQWVKSMGRQILAGNLNLVNTSFPVEMFEPRSFLEKLSDVWAYPDLLHAAATCPDPLERMKLLVTNIVAGSHKGFETWRKPFNPILGETWQATMPGTGISLYMEQVSHHPPVSAYELEGPGGAWSWSGWTTPAVAPVVKWYGIRTMAKGERRLRCADGSVLVMHMPHFAIKGVVYANRPRAEVIGTCRVVDAANGLEAVLHFGPVEGTRHRVLTRADAVVGEIYRLPAGGGGGGGAAAAAAAAGGGGSLVTLGRTATAAAVLSDMDGGGEVEADAEDEAIFDAVHHQLDTAPVDAQIELGGGASSVATSVASDTPEARSPTGASPTPPRTPPQCSSSGAGAGAPSPPPAAAARSKSMGGAPLASSSTCSSSSTSGGAGMWGGAKPQPQVPGVAVAYIEGSWLSHLNIDNKRCWTWSEARGTKWQPVQQPLPSDVRFRQDLAALAAGDKPGAAEWKTRLEQQQRADRKLREAAGVYEHH